MNLYIDLEKNYWKHFIYNSDHVILFLKTLQESPFSLKQKHKLSKAYSDCPGDLTLCFPLTFIYLSSPVLISSSHWRTLDKLIWGPLTCSLPDILLPICYMTNFSSLCYFHLLNESTMILLKIEILPHIPSIPNSPYLILLFLLFSMALFIF